MLLYQKGNSSVPYNFDRRRYQDFCFVSHLHRDFELVFVEAGRIDITVEGQTYSLEEGMAALVLPDHIHSYHTAEQSQITILVFADKYVPN